MNILLVAATHMETGFIRQHAELAEGAARQQVYHFDAASHRCTLLHTGVGMCNTSYWLGRHLALHPCDLAIQFGIAGSFDRSLALGEVVELGSDCFAELGASSPEGFLDMEAMGFPVLTTPVATWYNVLQNPSPPYGGVPRVSAITVNCVSGAEPDISDRLHRWQAQTESMEGAAFFHALLAAGIPFHAFRGISNYVEPRDKSQWKIALASENAQRFVISLLKKL